MKRNRVVALAGGIGAARFLDGLVRIVQPNTIFIVGNTGDDAEIHGLHISPDLDTLTYTLTGVADRGRGWGIRGDSFRCLESLARFNSDTWFQLGDRDLATHIYRTERLRQGATLTQVTSEITQALGLEAELAPMSNDRVRTRICTPEGELEFQTYFVKRRAQDVVKSVRFEGAAEARPAPGVLERISDAEIIILCPSNPFISIAPILAVPEIRGALQARRERVVAISPIVGGQALKGPAARMMESMCERTSSAAVARLYADFVAVWVLDEADRTEVPEVESLGMRVVVTNTVMHGLREKKFLARRVVRAMGMQL